VTVIVVEFELLDELAMTGAHAPIPQRLEETLPRIGELT